MRLSYHQLVVRAIAHSAHFHTRLLEHLNKHDVTCAITTRPSAPPSPPTSTTRRLCSGLALLTQKNPPTAVFAMSDEMAFGAMKAMRSHGLQPGKDISLVGVDGHDMSEFLDLTTVVQPVQDLGGTHASVNPMGKGFTTAQAHIDFLSEVRHRIEAGQTAPMVV